MIKVRNKETGLELECSGLWDDADDPMSAWTLAGQANTAVGWFDHEPFTPTGVFKDVLIDNANDRLETIQKLTLSPLWERVANN